MVVSQHTWKHDVHLRPLLFKGFCSFLNEKRNVVTQAHRSLHQSSAMPRAHEPLHLSNRSPLYWKQPFAEHCSSILHVPRKEVLNFWACGHGVCALWSHISAVFSIFFLLSVGCHCCIPLCPCFWSSMALEARHQIIAQVLARKDLARTWTKCKAEKQFRHITWTPQLKAATEPCTSTTYNHPRIEVAQSTLAYQAAALLCRQGVRKQRYLVTAYLWMAQPHVHQRDRNNLKCKANDA